MPVAFTFTCRPTPFQKKIKLLNMTHLPGNILLPNKNTLQATNRGNFSGAFGRSHILPDNASGYFFNPLLRYIDMPDCGKILLLRGKFFFGAYRKAVFSVFRLNEKHSKISSAQEFSVTTYGSRYQCYYLLL
jgi:hypothetical protein